MSTLAGCDNPQNWELYAASAQTILPAIESAVPRASNGKLTKLHSWFTTSLAETVSSRSPPFVTAEELERVMEYKLTRGAFRATLMTLIKSNSPAAVESASEKSFSAAAALLKTHPPTGPAPAPAAIKAVLEPLCTLRGVGPATASLVLSLPVTGLPFASDEALLAALNLPKGGKLAYSHPEYARFFAALWERRRAMDTPVGGSSADLGEAKGSLRGKGELSLASLAEALWVATVASKHGVALPLPGVVLPGVAQGQGGSQGQEQGQELRQEQGRTKREAPPRDADAEDGAEAEGKNGGAEAEPLPAKRTARR